MTKKVTKKNLLCLFPPKTGKSKALEFIQLMPSKKESAPQFAKQYAHQFEKPSASDSAVMNFSPTPDSTSDWQAHYDFLEDEGWGSGLFGAPIDREIETVALRAVQLAIESGDSDKIAKSYRHLFYLYCEFKHPDTLNVGLKSVAAAIDAYGQTAQEVGEELATIAMVHETNDNYDLAFEARDASIKIFAEADTNERLWEALEMAICFASDIGRADKTEEYARRGIQLVKERCEKDSDEYTDSMEYFEQMLDTAYDPPVPIEVKRQQIFSMFPKLQKMLEFKS